MMEMGHESSLPLNLTKASSNRSTYIEKYQQYCQLGPTFNFIKYHIFMLGLECTHFILINRAWHLLAKAYKVIREKRIQTVNP